MGCITSIVKKPNPNPGTDITTKKEEAASSQRIEKDIKDDKKQRNSTFKLLLLGPGESGKSTIFNQLKLLHAEGFTDGEKKYMKRAIQTNLLTAIQGLISGAKKLEIPYENPENEARGMKVLSTKDVNNINEIKEDIATLWSDQGIRQAYTRSNKFQLIDQAKYFLDSADHFCDPDFMPSEDDIIHCRAKTAAIVEMEITLDNTSLRVIDVGGQRNERKKWIHCFEEVTAVVYVTSLSEYDQTLFEDNKTNRMEESLRLFAEICTSIWFKSTYIIIFFNKYDIFKEKIQRVDPKDYCFPDYTGGKNEVAALEYIKKQFLSKNTLSNRTIFTKEICAIEKTDVDLVFKCVKNAIVQKNVENIFT